MIDNPRDLINRVLELNPPGKTAHTIQFRIIGYSAEHNEIRVESIYKRVRSTIAIPDLERALLHGDILLRGGNTYEDKAETHTA